MPFDTFDIKRESDNSVVDIDIVDSMVCDKFNMTFSEKDYGHFFFTDGTLNGMQKSISWPGLIHTVIYYSKIEWGKRTAYNMEATMAWVCTYAIHFPKSAIIFFKRLVDFLYQSGFYIFVNVNDHMDDSCGFGIGNFVNIRERSVMLKSMSGLFECDGNGKLIKFYPAPDNIISCERYDDYSDYYNLQVRHLMIPSGVKSICHEFFRYGYVKDVVEFPETLTAIGSDEHGCAFADCHLPDVILPCSIESLGIFAFGKSVIRSLRLPKGFNCEYARQFKGSQIEILYVPYSREEYDNQSGIYANFRIHCSIGEIVFLDGKNL